MLTVPAAAEEQIIDERGVGQNQHADKQNAEHAHEPAAHHHVVRQCNTLLRCRSVARKFRVTRLGRRLSFRPPETRRFGETTSGSKVVGEVADTDHIEIGLLVIATNPIQISFRGARRTSMANTHMGAQGTLAQPGGP